MCSRFKGKLPANIIGNHSAYYRLMMKGGGDCITYEKPLCYPHFYVYCVFIFLNFSPSISLSLDDKVTLLTKRALSHGLTQDGRSYRV